MIRPYARLRVSKIVGHAFDSPCFEGLIQAITQLDTPMSSGLSSARLGNHDWIQLIDRRDPAAFLHMLGPHVVSSGVSFDTAVLWLASPAHYALSEGFSVWGEKGLLIFSAFLLHGEKVFTRKEHHV